MITLAIGLIRLSFSSSSAQPNYSTIVEISEHPLERWIETYKTKWRDIVIDVQPTIPKIESFPILEIAIDFWQPDTAELGAGAIAYVADDGRFQINQNEIREAVNAITEGENLSPPYDMDYAYGVNSDLTLGDIIDSLRTIWIKLGQNADDIDYEKPLQFSRNGCYDEETKKYVYE